MIKSQHQQHRQQQHRQRGHGASVPSPLRRRATTSHRGQLATCCCSKASRQVQQQHDQPPAAAASAIATASLAAAAVFGAVPSFLAPPPAMALPAEELEQVRQAINQDFQDRQVRFDECGQSMQEVSCAANNLDSDRRRQSALQHVWHTLS